MRTNIDIDDALISEAMAASGLTTKKAVVEEGLRRLVRQKQEEQTLALYGTVDWEGDLEQSRAGPGRCGMIVVDTTVWIDFFRAKDTEQTVKLRRLIGRELILIGDILNLVEILQGLRDDAQANRVERALRVHRVEPMLSGELASKVASSYRLLRAKGITVRKTIDMIIGTF